MIRQISSMIYRHRVQVICMLCLFPVFLGTTLSSLDASPSKPVSELVANRSGQTRQVGKMSVKAEKSAKKAAQKAAKAMSKQAAPLITPPKLPIVKKKSLSKHKQIHLEHSESLSFDAFTNPDFQVLIGNVRFRHEGARLFCDSAHFFPQNNSLYAYGNVHMEQGDTIFLYGAWLYYDGNTKLVQVREKVRLENKKVTLFTDSLNYDRISNIGYFFDGGLLVNEDHNVTNELSSEYGQYSPQTKMADFKNDVKLVHPKFVLTNQELLYNTTTGVADINCPTDIVADSGYIFTDKGWYNSKTDQSQLLNRSYILNNHRRLTGDTINYNSKTGVGEGFGHVVLIDTTQQITLKGNYGYSEEKTQYALMADSALMIEHSSKDTLYLHADTLVARKDSVYNAVTAYHGVRFFRTDIQGVCDSLYYSTRDSVLSFYQKPVLWSEQQQLSGDFIQLHTKNNQADYLHIQKAAMVISMEQDSLYDQSSGKDLKAFFDSAQVKRVFIDGNAETIYLPRDDSKKKEIIGLNHLEGSSLNLFIENKKMKKLVVWPEPKGKFYPLNLLPSDARYLKNFVWHDAIRPKNPEDVYREVKPEEAPSANIRQRMTVKADTPLDDKKTVQPKPLKKAAPSKRK